MIDPTKKCPLCTETIKAEARLCRYCKARFEGTITGDCPVCHDEVPLNENDRCSRCGAEVMDRRVSSTLVGEPHRPASVQVADAPVQVPCAPAASPPVIPPAKKTDKELEYHEFIGSILMMINTADSTQRASLIKDLMNQRVRCGLCNRVVEARKAFQPGEHIGGAMYTVSP